MKSTLFTSLLALGIFPLFAQTSLLLNWEKELLNASGPAVVELFDVKAVSGAAVVVGNVSTADGIRMYAGQYDTSGNLGWEITLMSSESSSLSWIEVSNQGDIYVAGQEWVDAAVALDVPVAGRYQFSLYDLQGGKLNTIADTWLTADQQEVTLPLPGSLTPGMYLLRIETATHSAHRKVILK